MREDPNPIDRSLIGSASAPFLVTVERGAIVKFARAIGDSNPLFSDAAFAQQHGHADVVAPPTFPVSFLPPEEPAWWTSIDRKRILAGEQSFRYTRPIVAGDVIACQIHFVEVIEKKGRSGSMQLIVQENRGNDADSGEAVFTHRRVAVYRGLDHKMAQQ
ncbi:FAS1-like dehydratase domain-containing protein [Pseudohoeflea coraliihabitans]|uniref:MaoC family dehydratase N-terminal domain-containing protein n=1 Tax=Pseudohoeflea coraliihabitans TaxID=2860393 RepID=A0ABS6WIP3_9HYPH|nr:MaoC family dehydratase N-terminal domain-containing protein [Pseudohoeflea sp. DP4N28-3]MBW3095811.1 MaoC family dehydratase N-terminal domain-containing protein [Pseudohoeflea sp. DP4N28-3]